MEKYILPVLALSILIAAPVFGAEFVFENPFGETSDIGALVSKIIDFLIYLAIPVSTILILYAGFLYLTSAGNEEKIKTAQKALIWAIVGFAVILIASSVPAIIQEFLYGEPTTEELEETDSGFPESIQI